MSRLRPVILRVAQFLGIVALSALSLHAATPVSCSSPTDETPKPTEYFVSLADASNHMAHVSIRFRNVDRTLNMPVWNALYQVRDFAANIENVRAQDAAGSSFKVINSKTSEWNIDAGSGCVVVSYDIHLSTPGPFGTSLGAEHGFLNWAMVLMYSPAFRSQPMSIRFLDVPATWGMRDLHVLGEAAPGKVEQTVGTAKNFDELVDSPVELGAFQQSSYRQDGATYHIVVHGDPADYHMEKLDSILKQVTHAEVDWMQDRPFDDYTFLYHFPRGPAGGGMEHAYGTAIDVNAERLRSDYLPLASVTAHEFFHLWNVKRIRPQSLEPIDYQREMDTRALWFSEGVTSTVGDLMLVRSGLEDERMYLAQVSGEITELQGRPAHVWQSAEDSSLDAWFEGMPYYRSPERSISYYNKGEILGIMLDLRIRQLTSGTKSLRDLFHWMNNTYARQHRFFPDSIGVQQAAETVAGGSFAEFFHDYVEGVKEIPYDDFFQFVGLQVVQNTKRIATAGFVTTANLGGQPEVARVDPNSDAQRLGINIGDRVTSVNGSPADAYVDEELARLAPGTIVHLQLQNRRGTRAVDIRLGAKDEQSYELRDLPKVAAAQKQHRAAWIRGDDEVGAPH